MKSFIPPWLWDKFECRCFYCGSELYRPPGGAVDDGTILIEAPNSRATRDHIIPRSRGGTNARENLVLACQEHNVEKGGSTIDEYRVRFAATHGRGFYGERESVPLRDWLPVTSREFVKEIIAASVRGSA